MEPDLIAVLDIGKTHAKLLIVDAASGATLYTTERAHASIDGTAVRELDIAGIGDWLVAGLRNAPQRERIRHIVPIAHGAAAVLVDADGNAIAAPDYEDPAFDAVADAYRPLRDDFAQTGSPFLPLGLNLGRQWYLLQTRHPALFARVSQALLYPQYWAWRLCGVAASELTSLGCHSDLWRVRDARESDLARRQHWDSLLPPLHRAGDMLGTLTAELARAARLDPGCRVLCGLHDSNASYLSHRAARRDDRPFCVVSSGTWTIVLAHGSALECIREPLDMLANIDAEGEPVPTARFMGGREYARIAGPDGLNVEPDEQALFGLIRQGVLALPGFAAEGGPFARRRGSYRGAERLRDAASRAALATVYVALMTDLLLDQLDAAGDIILDGPLASNALYARTLQTLRSHQTVYVGTRRNGNAAAARHLVTGRAPEPDTVAAGRGFDGGELERYRSEWRACVAADARAAGAAGNVTGAG